MTVKKLKHPEVRKELISRLALLANKERILKEWPIEGSTKGLWWNMRFSLDSLFYDLSLLDTPENQLGYSIRDRRELDSICKVAIALNKLVREVGKKKLDADYISSPLLDELVNAAAVAYPLLKANDEKYGIE